MDKLTALILRLHRLGFRTQTIGTDIIVKLGGRSRLHGSADRIERILPRIEMQPKIALAAAIKAIRVKPKKRRVKARKRKGRGKIIVESERIPTISLETKHGRKSNRGFHRAIQGGLPGLGKRH